jgi:cellulose synthase/poly-beta-1,6-N-acetylglucosamine synthase-like glycosyltransferase
MKIAIIIPAHNEERFIKLTLDSLLAQSYLATKIIVVDDHSSDRTATLVTEYTSEIIELISATSEAENVPGAKVIRAFHRGLESIELSDYDVVCKFDADLIFPTDYLERVVSRFRESSTTGMVAGHCTVLEENTWILENQNNPDHIRGALKAYKTACFQQIGGLKESIGWDTVDEMLARFNGWEVITIPDLHVKHLKPTGAAYHSRSKLLQGEALYKMRYGWTLTAITAAKMALNKKSFSLFTDYLKGYSKASKSKIEPLVNADQGQFIRNYRWKGIKEKLGID